MQARIHFDPHWLMGCHWDHGYEAWWQRITLTICLIPMVVLKVHIHWNNPRAWED